MRLANWSYEFRAAQNFVQNEYFFQYFLPKTNRYLHTRLQWIFLSYQKLNLPKWRKLLTSRYISNQNLRAFTHKKVTS